MAGIEAIGLGAISSNSVKAVQGSAKVSVNTDQFDRFLQNGQNLASNADETADSTKSQKIAGLDKENVYSRREDMSRVSDESSAVDGSLGEEELAETANDLKEGIQDILKENLGIKNEEIDSILETMGVVITDLLNPQTLQQFVLQLNGGQENIDFLTNEALLSDFSDLLQDLEAFLNDDMKSLLTMMEEVDTPMTLDEFLAGQGITDESVVVSEEVLSDVTTSEQANVVVTQTENLAVDLSQDEADMAKIEKISIRTSEEPATKGNISVSQNLSEDSADNNAFSDGTQSQSSSEMLFTNVTNADESISTPLFAEQFDAAGNNVTRLFDNNIAGNQRMQQMIDIVNQVSGKIRSSLSANTTTMEVQLNPESLGKVFLSVASKEGVMTATFHVQSDEAKNALESQIYTLRENLEAKNLKVESVDVQISDFNFSQSNGAEGQGQSDSAEKGKKKFKYDSDIVDASDVPNEESAEQIRRQVMRDSGGSIDFTA